MGREGSRDSLSPATECTGWDGATGLHRVNSPSGRGPLTLPSPRLTPNTHTFPTQWPLPPPSSRTAQRADLGQKDADNGKRPPSTPPQSPEVTVLPLCPHSPSTILRGAKGTQARGEGLGNSCCPRPGKGHGLPLGNCSQIPGGTSHSATPHPPASYSVFLLLATQRPHRPHPPCGPAGSPPPPTRSHLASSSVSLSRLPSSLVSGGHSPSGRGPRGRLRGPPGQRGPPRAAVAPASPPYPVPGRSAATQGNQGNPNIFAPQRPIVDGAKNSRGSR